MWQKKAIVIRHLMLGVIVSFLYTTGQVSGQDHYAARLDAAQVVNNVSNSTATGEAFFTLRSTASGPKLDYSLQLRGLDLEPVMENRTDENDVVGIHIHLHVPGVIGPHILNIFGIPGNDDADLVVDYENEFLSGVFDISDATRNDTTGEIANQAFPLTTKIIDNWIDDLARGELYIAVHSRERVMNAAPGVDIRGNIYVVPEPSSTVLLIAMLLLAANFLRAKNHLVFCNSRATNDTTDSF